MKYITIEEKKQLMLEMLSEIDEFCRKNDIKYFLGGGTLLGAIRHKGYIPWDDDADIALMRDDYEKLISIFKSKSGNLELKDFRNDKHYIWPSAKFVHNKTVLIENNNKRFPIGVFIDVFPLDYVVGNKEKVISYQKKLELWKKILTLKYLHVDPQRGFLKNAVVLIGRITYLIPNKIILRKIYKLSTKYSENRDANYVCSFAGAWGEREISERELFDTAIECEFEGCSFMIPKGYDKFLTNIYGDYMTPPPIEKRKSTHNSVEYWK